MTFIHTLKFKHVENIGNLHIYIIKTKLGFNVYFNHKLLFMYFGGVQLLCNRKLSWDLLYYFQLMRLLRFWGVMENLYNIQDWF